jgi:hypothetical protein
VTETVVRPEVSHDAYRVVWSAEDQEFVATCASTGRVTRWTGSADAGNCGDSG